MEEGVTVKEDDDDAVCKKWINVMYVNILSLS